MTAYQPQDASWRKGKSVAEFRKRNCPLSSVLISDLNLTLVIPMCIWTYKCESPSFLTHQFIVKIHTYHQGNMFQLQGAITRPLYKNRSLSGFLAYDWDPNCLHYWGIVVYSVL